MGELYKDSSKVTSKGRQLIYLKEALKDIADKLKEAECSLDRHEFLKEWLYGDLQHGYEQNPKRDGCEGFLDDNKSDEKKGDLKEKRICKCMYYYGTNLNNCNNCRLKQKWHNVGTIKITDYFEVLYKNAERINEVRENQSISSWFEDPGYGMQIPYINGDSSSIIEFYYEGPIIYWDKNAGKARIEWPE